MARKIATHFPQVPLISSTELKRVMDEPFRASSVCIVDVRAPEEVEVSRIPTAITADEFEARRGELAGRTVVCYCTVGYRSSAHAVKLQAQGFEAKNLEGGIVRWAQKRFPLEGPSGQATKRIHVYGKLWALQPDDYEPVMFKNPFFSGLRRALPSWLGGKK